MDQRGTLIELPIVIVGILVCLSIAIPALHEGRWLKGIAALVPVVILGALLGKLWWDGRDEG